MYSNNETHIKGSNCNDGSATRKFRLAAPQCTRAPETFQLENGKCTSAPGTFHLENGYCTRATEACKLSDGHCTRATEACKLSDGYCTRATEACKLGKCSPEMFSGYRGKQATLYIIYSDEKSIFKQARSGIGDICHRE